MLGLTGTTADAARINNACPMCNIRRVLLHTERDLWDVGATGFRMMKKNAFALAFALVFGIEAVADPRPDALRPSGCDGDFIHALPSHGHLPGTVIDRSGPRMTENQIAAICSVYEGGQLMFLDGYIEMYGLTLAQYYGQYEHILCSERRVPPLHVFFANLRGPDQFNFEREIFYLSCLDEETRFRILNSYTYVTLLGRTHGFNTMTYFMQSARNYADHPRFGPMFQRVEERLRGMGGLTYRELTEADKRRLPQPVSHSGWQQ